MGPRPRGRGIGISGSPVSPAGSLQWGHDRAVVELRLLHLFGCLLRASMGPRPRGRGIRWDGNGQSVREAASMGPRPRGRGIAGQAASIAILTLLQWGHDRAVVEFSVGEGRCCLVGGFNGATTARSWNS